MIQRSRTLPVAFRNLSRKGYFRPFRRRSLDSPSPPLVPFQPQPPSLRHRASFTNSTKAAKGEGLTACIYLQDGAPTDPGYLFAQGASHGEALLVREGLSPRLRPSRALPRPPIKRLSTAAPPREETARAFIPTPCTSPRAFPHALHDEARGPKREFKRTSSLPGAISIVRAISIIRDPFFSRKETESGKRRLNCN